LRYKIAKFAFVLKTESSISL